MWRDGVPLLHEEVVQRGIRFKAVVPCCRPIFTRPWWNRVTLGPAGHRAATRCGFRDSRRQFIAVHCRSIRAPRRAAAKRVLLRIPAHWRSLP